MGRGDHLGEFEEMVLLAVARLDGEGHGAAIHREIQERVGRDASIPAVYVTLGRLEEKGYVESSARLGGSQGSGRPRKVFAISPLGIEELRAARVAHARLWDGLEFDPLGSDRR